jgi:GTP diphosphokinase / guanosine-3',5'-bis(diphosphate) 3'-diphosphatase
MSTEKDIELKNFLNLLTKEYSKSDLGLIEKAWHFSEEAHKGQKRASGDPYFYHCRDVAALLAELHMDCYSICAGLLHDIIEDTGITETLLKGEFPAPVAIIVLGVTKISTINFRSAREKQAENLRRMILAMIKDIRVIIVKLCDRLHNMRTLDHLGQTKRIRIAQDTLDIYAPLANRLGMMRIRSELEDLSMKYLYPEKYEELKNKSQHREETRAALIKRTKKTLEIELKRNNIPAKIEGRSKHLFSTLSKMKRLDLTFEEIYDLTAIRIITGTIGKCYEVLGMIHSMWHPIPGRLKDYIALPKQNQYQSLHTTVIGLEGEITEIQIRTPEMHQVAEEGIAAHWKYKEGKQGHMDIDKRLKWLRQLIDWINDIRDPDDFMEAFKEDVFTDIVFCFTPQGDIVELPKDATPLDFAYHIHTEVGNHCVGARVNKKYVSLKTTLKSGDIIEIITSNHASPSRDWLDLVKTGRARNKIKHYLKTKEFKKYAQIGHDMLVKALRARNLKLSFAPGDICPELKKELSPKDAEKEEEKFRETILKGCRVHTLDELYFEIGFGTLRPQNVAARFVRKKPKIKKKKKQKSRTPGIIVEGLHDAVVRYSNCCNPIPGDPITGFITRGRGISVHKSDCRSIHRLKNKTNGDPSRIINVSWDIRNLPKRKVNVRVVANDRTGLLKDISSTITNMKLSVEEMSSKLNRPRKQAIFRIMMHIDDTTQLNELLKTLEMIPGVISISRTVRNT